MTHNASIISVPYDKTSSFVKGADKGPARILEVFDSQIEKYEPRTQWEPIDSIDLKRVELQVSNLQPHDMVQVVRDSVAHQDSFFVCLGGEHSVSIGVFEALAQQHKPEDVTIVHIDAHFDLREDDSDYSDAPTKYAHSDVMKRALDLGFKTVTVGVRSFAKFELETAQKHAMPYFQWPCDETKELLKDIIGKIGTKKVYITLDVDGVDPAHLPATGTPVQGGLSWKFLYDLLEQVFEKDVVGCDIVEVCPRPNDVLTEMGAAQLLYYMLALKFKPSTL